MTAMHLKNWNSVSCASISPLSHPTTHSQMETRLSVLHSMSLRFRVPYPSFLPLLTSSLVGCTRKVVSVSQSYRSRGLECRSRLWQPRRSHPGCCADSHRILEGGRGRDEDGREWISGFWMGFGADLRIAASPRWHSAPPWQPKGGGSRLAGGFRIQGLAIKTRRLGFGM